MPIKCANPGCLREIPRRRTRPYQFCSLACRAQYNRLRKRILDQMQVTELVALVRALLSAWCEADGLNAGAALHLLSAHPLVQFPWPLQMTRQPASDAAGPQATGDNKRLVSSPAQGGGILAAPPNPAALDEVSISADISDPEASHPQ